MSPAEFQARARAAKLLTGDYGAGYQRGLRRLHHGAAFGTEAEHALWMQMGLGVDTRIELGRGYRDGYQDREPAPRIGRPPAAAVRSELPVRTMRLSDAHWTELQARGGIAALREWLSRPVRSRTQPRA